MLNEGCLVLIKAYLQSKAILGKVSNFAEVYKGPYINTRRVDDSTYKLGEIEGKRNYEGYLMFGCLNNIIKQIKRKIDAMEGQN